MKIKINSHIVGYRQPPGTIFVVGEDITEEEARVLLGMGKEAELLPEEPVDDRLPEAPAIPDDKEAFPSAWFAMPVCGPGNTGNSPSAGKEAEKSTVRTRGGKKSAAAS